MKRLLVIGLWLGLALPAWAEAPFGAIKAVKQLPISGVNIIESDKGTFFVSSNGRFVFKGPIYDLWNAKPINTLEEAEQVAGRINLQKVGVNLDDLAALTLGKGDKEEVVFLSPGCPHCHRVLEQAAKLGDKYKFRLVLLPLGQKALEQAKRLVCAAPEKALPALLKQDYSSLPEGQCSILSLQKTLVVARVLEITAVPYLVRHDGATHRGEVKDLAAWLAAAKEG